VGWLNQHISKFKKDNMTKITQNKPILPLASELPVGTVYYEVPWMVGKGPDGNFWLSNRKVDLQSDENSRNNQSKPHGTRCMKVTKLEGGSYICDLSETENYSIADYCSYPVSDDQTLYVCEIID
jgi:hypothetical protein